MAFYGRLTNESKTSMTFDRVYPNRVTMDAMAESDGVFTGRFVLVEYDAIDETIVYDDSTDNTEVYNKNYNKDKEVYPKLGRGYDSTVWRKVVTADEEGNPHAHYVMLAELNSVVPSFGITALAPSDDPIKPEFGQDSSNIYYNLKLQTPWGFDVAEINYNKPGLDISTHTDSVSPSNEHIYFDNTASGAFYDGEVQDDIKQLHVNIPEIGNMVGEGWDRIYGYNPEDDKRNTSVMWKDATAAEMARPLAYANGAIIQDALIQTDGKYNGSIGSPAHIDNLADAIRYVYDTLGMIIEPISLADYLEPATVARPLSETSPGYIYYLEDSDEDIDASEDLTEEEKEQLKNHRFLWLGEKFDFADDEYTSEDAPGLVKGKKPYPVNADALLDFPPESPIFLKTSDNPIYKQVDSNQAVAETKYYTLDLSDFTETSKFQSSNNNFKELILSHTLFKKTLEGTSVVLTEVVDEDEPYDDTAEYFIVPNISPSSESDPGLPGFSSAIFRATYGSSKEIFFNATGTAYNEETFRGLENGTPIYLKEEPEEHYDEIEKKYVITNVYTQVGVKGDTLSDCTPTLTVDNTKILAWPLNNNQTQSNDEYVNWDPEIEGAQQSRHFWIGSTDEETGARIFKLQATAPVERIEDGVQNRVAALMIVGKQPTGGGYGDQDRRVDNLYSLTEIEPVSDFIIPDTDFWVYSENDGVVYKITEEMMPLPEAHLDCVYKLTSEFDPEDGDPISGVNGQQKIETATPQYYFVPNQLYKEENGEYVKATSFDSGTQYFTLLDLCVKSDSTGQFNIGEEWNPNLNLDEINSPETVVTLGYKTSKLKFFPLNGYAKDLNTINGIILAMNRLMGADDPASRDTSTVQGLINALNDKLDKLDHTPGNSLVVTDKYGHLDSVVKVGPESETANVYEPSTKTPTEGYDAFITQSMSGATLVDGTVIPDFTADTNTDGLNNNSWITADIKTNSDGQAFGYILHNTVSVDTTTAAPTDLNDPSIDTITIKDIQYDNAGHIISDKAHVYTLPYGFKNISVDGTSVIANSTQDTLTFSGDAWINVTGDAANDKVTFTHTATGSLSAGDTTARTPSFGGTFNTLAVRTDEAGHVSTLSAYSVTIPSISFDGAGSSSVSGDGTNVMTGLAFDNTTGQLTATYTTVGTLSSVATSTTTDTSAITNSDSLADALKKLQNRIDNVISSIDGLDRTLTCSDVPGLSFTITQEDGALSTFSGDVNWVTIGDAIATTTLSTAPLNTTAQTIQGAINELQNAINSSAFSPADYARIFRIPSAPQNDNTDYTTVNGVYGTSFDATTNPFLSGWMWIDTSTNYIYFYTGTAWELLNSWR